MFHNRYDGVLEPWKVKLIVRRARRLGFRGADLEDAQQQVVLALLSFRFDCEKSHGGGEATATTAVIDRQLAMIRRSHARAKRREQKAQEWFVEACRPAAAELAIDVQKALQTIAELDRRICHELAQGQSVRQVARTLGIGWHAARTRIESIRRHFRRLGLDDAAVRTSGDKRAQK